MNRPGANVKLSGRQAAAIQFSKRALGVTGSRSYLRCDASIQTTTQNINFNILQNTGSTNNTENRLKISDAFIVTSLGFYLVKAGASTTATQAEIGAARLHTFPNSKVFTGSGESGLLENIYNGFAVIKVNQVTYFPALAMRKFHRVGTAQEGTTLFTSSTQAASTWEGPDYGLLPLTPTIMFNGQGQNDVSIQLPNSSDLKGTSSQNFLVMFADGILLPNAAGRVTADIANVFAQQFGA